MLIPDHLIFFNFAYPKHLIILLIYSNRIISGISLPKAETMKNFLKKQRPANRPSLVSVSVSFLYGRTS